MFSRGLYQGTLDMFSRGLYQGTRHVLEGSISGN